MRRQFVIVGRCCGANHRKAGWRIGWHGSIAVYRCSCALANTPWQITRGDEPGVVVG